MTAKKKQKALDPADNVSEAEVAEALDPNVGTGTPDTAPWERPPVSLIDREPVRVLGAAQAIVAAAVAIIALGVPVWAGLLVAVVLYVVDELQRWRVTPVAAPSTVDPPA